MSRLSDRQIAGVVKSVGFPKSSWNTAVAVALAESQGNPDAINTSNSDGSTDYGLFQINSVHSDLLSSGDWHNPTDNARMALAISSHGTNWEPWTTYRDGAFSVYLPRAKVATGNPIMPSGGGVGNSSGITTVGFPNPISGAKNLIDLLSNKSTWIRLGMILAGLGLLYIALSRETKIDNYVAKAAEIAAVA